MVQMSSDSLIELVGTPKTMFPKLSVFQPVIIASENTRKQAEKRRNFVKLVFRVLTSSMSDSGLI